MAKKKTTTTVFLIVDANDLRRVLAGGLKATGYDVHDYMTVNEFLIDRTRIMVSLSLNTDFEVSQGKNYVKY